MGRKRRHDKGLPARVYKRGASYYYVRHDGKWIRLARTLPEMYARLAEVVDNKPNAKLLSGVFARYRTEELPKKAPSTQKNNLRALRNLEDVFGNEYPDNVSPAQIYEYLQKRTAKVEANREISLLQHVYKRANQWGMATTNPCIGVERNKETPARHYITDDQFMIVYRVAPPMIRYAMAIAYLTGQRQADVLKLRRRALLDEGIYFRQRKTGNEIIVAWTPALRKTIRRAITHGDRLAFDYIIRTRAGHPYSSSGFQTVWKRFMRTLPEERRFMFRDIRAKSRSDGADKRLLGHANPDAMARIYQRKPTVVRPVK